MQNNDWVQVGENIKQCVQNAIDSQDFEGLSKTIESSVNGMVNQLNQKFAFNQMKSSTYEDSYKYAQAKVKQQAARQRAAQEAKAAQARRQRQAVAVQQQNRLPQLYPKTPPGTYMAPVCKVLGIVGSSVFGIGTFVLTLLALITGNGWIWFADTLVGGFLGGSVAMTNYGVKTEGMLARFKKYVARIGEDQYCDIQQLANIVGKKKSFVEREIRKMIDKGFFLQGHIDDRGTTLITSDAMYKNYLNAEQSRRIREIEMKHKEKEVDQITITEVTDGDYPENVRSILREGNKYIQHIRESNDAIPGEVMSQKLYTLEDIMSRIFEQLKKHPESAEDLQKMMKYYLPTTSKLIDAYREMDGQPSYGENNIAKTKMEIENTLDIINEAFGKLFDDMFEDAAWDISTEISTMKTLLAKEGLTGGEDFKID